MHANTPGTLSCRVSWTRRPHVPSIFCLPCMCSFPLSRGLEGHSRHRCAVPFILAHTPYSMMVQAPGERHLCSAHCPWTGTVCADHVVSGPFLLCTKSHAVATAPHARPTRFGEGCASALAVHAPSSRLCVMGIRAACALVFWRGTPMLEDRAHQSLGRSCVGGSMSLVCQRAP